MENNPRKSKAGLITFIIVLILLIIGFFLFRNMSKVSETKSTNSGSNKIFQSLFGSKKATELTTINPATVNTDDPQSGTGTDTPTNPTDPNANGGFGNGDFGSNGNFGDGTGFGITPPLNPIATPEEDGDWNTTPNTPIGNPRPPIDTTPTPIVEKYCPTDDPLVFTDAEKAELDALLKDYYSISYLLKTEDDITILEDDIKTNQDLVNSAEKLTLQCEVEKGSYRYTGPKAIKDNPYYDTPINSVTPYIPTYEILEDLFKVW